MKKVDQKQERPKAMIQASLRRGCCRKRPTLAQGLTARAGPALIAGLPESRRYQNMMRRMTDADDAGDLRRGMAVIRIEPDAEIGPRRPGDDGEGQPQRLGAHQFDPADVVENIERQRDIEDGGAEHPQIHAGRLPDQREAGKAEARRDEQQNTASYRPSAAA